MSVAMESISIRNPNPTSSGSSFSKRASSMAACASSPQLTSSLRFQSLLRRPHHTYRASILLARCASPKRLFGSGFPSLDSRTSSSSSLNHRSIVALAASHENSKHSDVEVEKEKDTLEAGAEESQKAWKEALASFKEQALKMQSVSQEAYEVYSKKAMVILQETSEQLKIQADKTRHDLSVIAKEVSEEGQVYLSTAAEQSPEPVKDIVETFASSKDELKDISKVQDFHLGIPYGVVLSLSGFLSFMITGSISAIRFGVILGGTLLALSISSLRSQKRGESFPLFLKGQAAIASVIFLRELRLLSQGASFFGCFATLISGGMVAFYLYRITSSGKLTGGSNLKHGTES